MSSADVTVLVDDATSDDLELFQTKLTNETPGTAMWRHSCTFDTARLRCLLAGLVIDL